jgi:hypothetical protein
MADEMGRMQHEDDQMQPMQTSWPHSSPLMKGLWQMRGLNQPQLCKNAQHQKMESAGPARAELHSLFMFALLLNVSTCRMGQFVQYGGVMLVYPKSFEPKR